MLGMYHALIEARLPFELVHEALPHRRAARPVQGADPRRRGRAVGRAVRGDPRATCERGGSLVATFASSLYDEWGQRRKDFGLADVFGVSFNGRIEGPMQNSYLSLDADPAPKTLSSGAARAWKMRRASSMASSAIDVRPTQRFPSPVTLIPTYPDLPMEDVYPRVPHTDTRELYLRDLGRSRVAYVPWDIDRTFWEVMSPDHGRLLRNVISWAMNEPPPVEVDGRGVIDVTVWRQRDSMTVHLVNLTNPMMMKGPLREAIPIGPLTVRVRVPNGLARAEGPAADRRHRRCSRKQAGGAMTVTVPTRGRCTRSSPSTSSRARRSAAAGPRCEGPRSRACSSFTFSGAASATFCRSPGSLDRS